MKTGPGAVDQSELIISDMVEQPSLSDWWEDEYEEQPPMFPSSDEAPWLITGGYDEIGNSDSLDYAWSLNHYDGGY